MNEADLKRMFPNASASTIRRNLGMGGLQPEVREHKTKPALERDASGWQRSEAGMGKRRPQFRVHLANFRRRQLDSDNMIFAMKNLRDAIAKTLGLDDNDKNIEWEYSQVLTRGKQGTAVKMERLCQPPS